MKLIPNKIHRMDDDKKNIFGWSVLCVIAIAAFGGTILRELGVFDTQLATLCDGTQQPKSHTIFLLDFSDKLTDEVAESIKANIHQHQDSSEVGGQLTLLRITPELYAEDHKICKPPHPSVRNKKWHCATPLSGIDKSREEDAKRFCEFSNAVDAKLKTINEHAKGSLPYSPLIESLASISQRADFTSSIPRKIVLYSDLLQNTNKYSFYSGRVPQPHVDTVIRDDTIDLSNLSGVEIEVQYIQRSQSAGIQNFWKGLFEKLTGKSPSIIPLHHKSQQ